MSPRRILLLWAAGVSLAVALLYGPTLRGGFAYDSIAQVLYSDYIHTSANWVDVLTLRVVGQDQLDRNRPLFLASLMLDAAIWKREPFGYRLTSVLLHALNASLLFLFIAVALRGRTPPVAAAACPPLCGSSPSVAPLSAAFSALVFALHPLVVEAVAEPSNREDLLVLLPMLVGLICLAAPLPSRTALNAVLILCSFFAVLAKESGIAVPFVFAGAGWWSGHFRRSRPGLLAGLLAAIGFLVASYIWRPSGSAIFVNSPQPLADNVWTIFGVQLRIWTLQFWQIVWPWNLSAHYTADAIAGITIPLASAVVAVVVVVAVFVWRMDRLAALGVTVYVLCLLPASNFAAQYHPIADRYLYVPLAGLGMIAAVIAYRLRIKYPCGFAGGVLVAILLAFLSLEYAANLRRQFIWQQPRELWSDVLLQFPGLSQALIGMANVYFREGDFEAARTAADDAVAASNGAWADAWALRAICEWRTGRREEALASFARARELSRAYANSDAMARALMFSPEQLVVLGELLKAATDAP